MAISRIGAYSTGTSTSTSYPQTPIAGNILVLDVLETSNGGLPGVPTTPSGWTLGQSNQSTVSLVDSTTVARFWKVAAGGDTAVTLAGTSGVLLWAISEWSGVAAVTPHDNDGAAVQTQGASTNITPSCSTAQASELVLTLAVIYTGGGSTVTWGGGTSSDLAVQTNGTSALALGKQIAGSGTISPTVQATSLAQLVAFSTSFKPSTTTSVTLTETGSGTDTATVTATAPLADARTATDAITTSATLPLADTGTGTDTVATTAAVTLADTVHGTDALAASVTLTMADSGAGADAFSTAPAVPLADTAHGTDAFAVAVTVTVTDVGASADALTTSAPFVLAETATAADGITVVVTFAVSDPVLVSDGFGAGTTVTLVDSGSGSDSVALITSTVLGDTATVLDLLATAGPSVPAATERTVHVTAEGRTITVRVESRARRVPSESRTTTVRS